MKRGRRRAGGRSIGRATGWKAGVRFPAGAIFFLYSTMSRPVLGPTQSPIRWIPRYLSLGLKTDHSPPSSAEVKYGGAMAYSHFFMA
jgi:hypothetical protein